MNAYSGVMSDLQCPARVYLARNDLPPGRVRSAVEGEQIAAEYAVPPDHPVGSAWLDDIIDRHRGEAVLVVAPVAVITGWLHDAGRRVNPADVLAFDVDSDGWRARAVVTGPIPIQRAEPPQVESEQA